MQNCDLINKGKNLNLLRSPVPLNDKLTIKIFENGDTSNILGFSSTRMQKFLRTIRPANFFEIADALCLFEIDELEQAYVQKYIGNKKNKYKIKYLHPIVKDVLHQTFGVMIYQEQFMELLNKFTGMSMEEVNRARKNLQKKHLNEIKKMKNLFIKNSKMHDCDQITAEKIFEQHLLQYCCLARHKAHFLTRAMIAWRMAYIKANFPGEFTNSVRICEGKIPGLKEI